MSREKKVEMVSEMLCVSVEAALAALEKSDWRMPDAARRLLYGE